MSNLNLIDFHNVINISLIADEKELDKLNLSIC